MAHGESRRKFPTEFTLVITVVGAGLLRASDLNRTAEPEEKCHLYVISSTPMLTVDPDKVVIGKDALVGRVAIHSGGTTAEHDFAFLHQGTVAKWHSEWPHTDFELRSESGDLITGGPVGLLGHMGAFGWPTEASTHQVLYVGQAFGKDGSRTAWDRLRRHETLQQILAENQPDRDIWLTLATIIDTQVVSETVPDSETQASDDDDTAHFADVYTFVHSEGFKDGDGVSIAEAGLIRGFQPKHNTRLKETFPAPTQKSLETVRSLDFHSVIVEWQATNLDPDSAHSIDRYRSDAVPECSMVFFNFTIHTDPGRATTLLLSNQTSMPRSPGKPAPDLSSPLRRPSS